MDADYMVEDDPLVDVEPDEDDGKPLDSTPKLQHQQSLATDASLNSLLTLAEGDTSGIEVDRPTIIIKGPEDSDEEPVKESKSLIEKRRSESTEPPARKRERRGGTGRTTSDEKSQTGRVSLYNISYVEHPVSDLPKCQAKVVAYESYGFVQCKFGVKKKKKRKEKKRK